MATNRQLEPVAGYILHRRPWRESSLLAEAFTRSQGRIGLIARGAKRPKSRWRGLLEPFKPLDLSWSGRSELRNLRQAEPRERSQLLSGSAVLAGLYVNELMLRLLARDDPHPQLFDRYHELLSALVGASALAAPIRLFEKQLLAEIGYGLNLSTDVVTGEPLQAHAQYRYEPDRGAIRADTEEQDGVLVSGATLLALAADRLDDEGQRNEARLLLRACLRPHIGPRPLHSPEFVRRMQHNLKRTAL